MFFCFFLDEEVYEGEYGILESSRTDQFVTPRSCRTDGFSSRTNEYVTPRTPKFTEALNKTNENQVIEFLELLVFTTSQIIGQRWISF